MRSVFLLALMALVSCAVQEPRIVTDVEDSTRDWAHSIAVAEPVSSWELADKCGMQGKQLVALCLYRAYGIQYRSVDVLWGRSLPRRLQVVTRSHHGPARFIGNPLRRQLTLIRSQGQRYVKASYYHRFIFQDKEGQDAIYIDGRDNLFILNDDIWQLCKNIDFSKYKADIGIKVDNASREELEDPMLRRVGQYLIPRKGIYIQDLKRYFARKQPELEDLNFL